MQRKTPIARQVRPDRNGEYNLSSLGDINGRNTIFYDGDLKIAEIQSNDDQIYFQIFTSVKTHINIDVDAGEFGLDAVGEVTLHSNIKVKRRAIFKGELIDFTGNIDARRLIGIHKDTIFNCKDSKLSTKRISNNGVMFVTISNLKIDIFEQQHVFNCFASFVEIAGTFIHGETATTIFDECISADPRFDHCGVNINALRIYGGDFRLLRSTYNGREFDAQAGLVALHGNMLMRMQSMRLGEQVNLSCKHGKLIIDNDLISYGNTEFDWCEVYSNGKLCSYGNKIKSYGALLQFKVDFTLKGIVSIVKTNLTTDGSILVKASGHLDFSTLIANKSQKYDSQQLIFNYCYGMTQILYLYGGDKPGSLVARSTSFLTGLLVEEGCVEFIEDSILNANVRYGDDEVLHRIAGHLQVIDSLCVSKASMHYSGGGKLSVMGTSDEASEMIKSTIMGAVQDDRKKIPAALVITLKTLFSDVAIDAEKADISVKAFEGLMASINLRKNAHMQAESVHSLGDSITLGVNAEFFAPKYIGNPTIKFEGGGQFAAHDLTFLHGSLLTGSKGSILAKVFTSFAEENLVDAKLRADKCWSYYRVRNAGGATVVRELHRVPGSTIQTKKHTLLTTQYHDASSRSTYDDSHLVTTKLKDAFANPDDATQLAPAMPEQVVFYPGNCTKLVGATLVKSDEIVIGGLFESKAKKRKMQIAGLEEPDQIPQLEAKEGYILDGALVVGSDLISRIEKLIITGDVALTDSFIGFGESLIIPGGSLKSGKAMQLNYDSTVSVLFGIISSGNVSINCPIVLNLGMLSAEQRLHVNALYYFSLLTLAHKSEVNAIVSASLLSGASVPFIDPKSLLSSEGLASLGQFALGNIFSGYKSLISLIFAVPNIISAGKQIWSTIKKLNSQKESVRPYQIMELLGQAINGYQLVHGAVSHAIGSASELKKGGTPFAKSKSYVVKQIAKDTLDMMMPSIATRSIFSLSGLQASYNTTHQNIFGATFGAALAANRYSQESIFSVNAGIKIAPHYHLSAYRNESAGLERGTASFNYDVTHTVQHEIFGKKSLIQGHNAKITGKSLDKREGDIKTSGESFVDIAETIGSPESGIHYDGLLVWRGHLKHHPGPITGSVAPDGTRSIFQHIATAPPFLGSMTGGETYISGEYVDGKPTRCGKITFADGSVAELNDGTLYTDGFVEGKFILALNNMSGEIGIFNVDATQGMDIRFMGDYNSFYLGQWSGDGPITWEGNVRLILGKQPTYTGNMTGKKTKDEDLYEIIVLPPADQPAPEIAPAILEALAQSPPVVAVSPVQEHVNSGVELYKNHLAKLEAITTKGKKGKAEKRKEGERYLKEFKEWFDKHPHMLALIKQHEDILSKISEGDKKARKAENTRFGTLVYQLFQQQQGVLIEAASQPPEQKADPLPVVVEEKPAEPIEEPKPLSQKVAKPRHILTISSDAPIALTPHLTGGDAVNTVGLYNPETKQYGRAPELIIPPNPQIELRNGHISAEKVTGLELTEQVLADQFWINFENTMFDVGVGGIRLPKGLIVRYLGECRGKVKGDFIDQSRTSVQGHTQFIVEGHHGHTGIVTGLSADGEDYFGVQAKTGDLKGSSLGIGHLAFDYEQFLGDAVAFIENIGRSSYKYLQGFHLGVDSDTTPRDITGDRQWALGRIYCGGKYLSFAAPALKFSQDIMQDNFQLFLRSKKGKTGINAKMVGEGSKLVVDSEKSIDVSAEGFVLVQALYMTARTGDINIYAGLVGASEFAQLSAVNGYVNLFPEIGEEEGKYGKQKFCNPAVIAGGNGAAHHGVGLVIYTKEVRGDASHIAPMAGAHMVLVTETGVALSPVLDTHVSYDKTHHTGFLSSTRTHEVRISTNVFRPILGAAGGMVYIIAPQGTINSLATIIPAELRLNVRDTPVFKELIIPERRYKTTDKLWGLQHKESEKYLEEGVFTEVLDSFQSYSTFNEDKEDKKSKGPGDFSGLHVASPFPTSTPRNFVLWADSDITFSQPILTQHYKQRTRGVTISVLGVPLLRISGDDITKHILSLMKSFTTESAVYHKFLNLATSRHLAEIAIHSATFAVELANTLHSLYTQSVSNILLQRFGFDSERNFNPSLRVGAYYSSTEMYFQTLSQGGIQVDGYGEVHAGDNAIRLNNGVCLVFGAGFEGDARELIGSAARLTSSTVSERVEGSVSVTPMGAVSDASVCVIESSAVSETFVPSYLVVDGVMDLHHGADPMKKITFDGFNITAAGAKGGAEVVEVIPHQSTSEAESFSLSVSTGGVMSAQQNKGKTKTAPKENVMTITGAVDPSSEPLGEFKIGVATGAGGSFVSPDSNPITITEDRRTAAPEDSHHRSIIGASVSVPALAEVLGAAPSTADAPGSLLIPTIGSITYGDTKKTISIDVPSPQGLVKSIKTVYDTVQSLFPRVEDFTAASEIEPRHTYDIPSDESVSAHQQTSEFGESHTTYQPTDLAPIREDFDRAAQMFDENFKQLEMDLAALVAQETAQETAQEKSKAAEESIAPQNIAQPIIDVMQAAIDQSKQSSDVTHAELKQAEDKFKGEHLLLYTFLNPDGDAISEYFDTPPLAESVMNGLIGGVSDNINLGSHVFHFLQDLGSVIGHYSGDEPLVVMQDNPAFPAMRKRFDGLSGLAYEMVSFVGDFGAVGLYPTLLPASIYSAASYRMDQRMKFAGNLLYHFFARPLENTTRVLSGGCLAGGLMKAGSYTYNTYQRSSLFVRPAALALDIPEGIKCGKLLFENLSIQPYKLTRPFMRENDLYTYGYKHVYGTTAESVVTTYEAIQKIADHTRFGWLSDFLLAESSKGKCPLFVPAGQTCPNGFLGWWTPNEKIKGNFAESPWHRNGYLQVPSTSISLYVEDAVLSDIAEVAAHEAGHHAAYLFTSDKWANPFVTSTQKRQFNSALIADANQSIPSQGIQAISFDSPEAYLFRLPREYFNNVFREGFSSSKWSISTAQVEYALKEAEFAFYNGQSEREVLVKLFSDWKVEPKITESAYWVADAKRSSEYPAYYISAVMRFPWGDIAKRIQNTLPIYEQAFSNIYTYLSKKGLLRQDMSRVSSSRFGLFSGKDKRADIVIPATPLSVSNPK